MSSSGGASQFTDSNCEGFGYSDIQLAKNVFADSGTDPFVFECMNKRYTGPTSFPSCNPYFTSLCIGAHGQQHACVVAKCHVVDWSGPHANACNSNIMQFASVQAAGLNALCCDSGFCSEPVSETSDPLSGPQQVCDPNRQLWLCVNDGFSVECANTRDQSICSGNFTSHTTATGGSSPNPTQFSLPSQYTATNSLTFPTSFPTNNSNSDTATGASSQTRTIIIAVVASVVGLLVVVLAWVLVRRRRRYQPVPVHPLGIAPPMESPQPVSSPYSSHGALTYPSYGPVQNSDYSSSGYATSSNSEPSNMVMDSNLTSVAGNMSNYTNVTVNHYHSSQSSR